MISGHKAYAAYGSGALVGPRDWLDAAPPYVFAAEARRTGSVSRTSTGHPPLRVTRRGTPNAIGAVALVAAAHALTDHRHAALAAEHAPHRTICEGLATILSIKVLRLLEDGEDNVGVTTFMVAGYDPTLVAQVLADEYGIAVRDGRFCAHLLCDELLGDGATAVRASLF